MMGKELSKESFAANFIAGKVEGSLKMRWWLRHGHATSLYVQKWASKKTMGGKGERASIRSSVEKSCMDWGSLVYQSQKVDCMTEHADLEMALVDASLGMPDGSEDTTRLRAISALLNKNIRDQIEQHEFQIKDFPSNRFKDLMFEHVKLFTESVRWFVTPDERQYASTEELRLKNTLALAAFSTEWM